MTLTSNLLSCLRIELARNIESDSNELVGIQFIESLSGMHSKNWTFIGVGSDLEFFVFGSKNEKLKV